MWRDDGVGSITAETLPLRAILDAVDGRMVPENYLETVIRHDPATVLIIDAVDFDGRPGELRLLAPSEIVTSGLSTHAGSPATLAQYLSARADVTVALLAIQPGDTGEGSELSPDVAATMRELVETLEGATDWVEPRS